MLTEDELRSGLRELNAAPPAPAERFASVERRALRTRRRRQSAAAGLAALAVLAVALPSVLSARRPAPPASRPAGLPRDVVVYGDLRAGVLPSLDGEVADAAPVEGLRWTLQLDGGEIVGIARRDGVSRLLRLHPAGPGGRPADLGLGSSAFASRRPREVWRVEQLDDCPRSRPEGTWCDERFSARRVSLDGRPRGSSLAFPPNVQPVGETPAGLLVRVERFHPGQARQAAGGGTVISDHHTDLAIADRESGVVGRVVATDVSFAAVSGGGRLVWTHGVCTVPCSLYVEDPDGVRRDLPRDSHDGEGMSPHTSVSPDGRWYASAFAPMSGGTSGTELVVTDLDSGRKVRMPYRVTSATWSGNRLLFLADGRLGAYVPATGELRLSGQVPGDMKLVAGALDLLD